MTPQREPRTDPIDDALQYALAFLNDPEGLASAREEWRDKVRDALKARRAEAAGAPLREAIESATLLLAYRIERQFAGPSWGDFSDNEQMRLVAERYNALATTPAPAPLDERALAEAMPSNLMARAGVPLDPAELAAWVAARYARLTARAAATEDTQPAKDPGPIGTEAKYGR